MKHLNAVVFAICCAGLSCACGGRDPKLQPIKDFDSARYLGTWHEIARLDHRFERGLTQVSAEYSRGEDGKLAVLNKGYDAKSGHWKSIKGVAKFTSDETTGDLRVSFFRPFYGDYIILELDRENYSYALVSGGNTRYLWILARTTMLDKKTTDMLVGKAKALGFNTDKLIFVQ